MKTKNVLVAVITSIFSIGMLSANESVLLPKEPVMAPKEISASVAKVVQDELYYPEFAIVDKLQGKVAVEIQITEEGKFDVIASNSVYADLKAYAAKTIEGIDTEDFKAYAGQKVILNLTYDLKLH